MELTETVWDEKTCPVCGLDLQDEPKDACTEPRFRLLHWLCYLSEDRICAGWIDGCQDTVLGWCERPIPDVEPWEWPGYTTVYESEAKAVRALVDETGGEWRWDDIDTEPCPQWHPSRMTLGAIIEELERAPQDRVVRNGFRGGHSYRGNYRSLAVEPAANVRVSDMLATLRGCLGRYMAGHKGGSFLMHEGVTVYIAEAYSSDGSIEITAPVLERMLADHVEPLMRWRQS